MTRDEVFGTFKSLLVKSHLHDDPSLPQEKLQEIAKNVEATIHLTTPLNELGLDSMTMTWIIVSFEQVLDVDASGVSFFELFDVNDLVNEIMKTIK
jgi:acyl carrier protein